MIDSSIENSRSANQKILREINFGNNFIGGNCRIFLSLRLYVKYTLADLECQNLCLTCLEDPNFYH